MSNQQISNLALQFIRERITSVAQLELLLLLRTTSGRSWSAAELGRELRVQESWAAAELQELCDQRLLIKVAAPEPRYEYRPATAELEEAVTAVAQAYLLHRVSVIETVYSRSTETIRAFADAFKLRKEPPSG